MENKKKRISLMKKVFALGMMVITVTSFVGCETNTNAGEQIATYESKYMSSDETIKYESKDTKLKIATDIKKSPGEIPQVKTTMYKPDEQVVVKQMLQEGMRTEFYNDESPQYSGKSGDVLNITADGFYMLSEFYNHIFYCFRLSSRDPEYNADKYSKTIDFEFMKREEAVNTVVTKLENCGINIGEYDAEIYCLDYETLKNEEYVIDKDGEAPKGKWKDSWTEDDNCYYITIRQRYNDIPEYHLFGGIYRNYEDYNSPIQAIVSREGIKYLEVKGALQFRNTQSTEKILDPSQVLDKIVENKYYESDWEKKEYTLTKMNLCYFSNIAYGEILETIPVYQCYIEEKYWDGTEWGEKVCQLIIDARTGKEADVFDPTQKIINK